MRTKGLPANTRQHLYNLVTDANYHAASQNLNTDPQTMKSKLGGVSVKKFGYAQGMPAGGGGAGRHRLVRRVQANRITWWHATHVAGNEYKYEQIHLPRCQPCHSTGERVCPACRGARRTMNQRVSQPCRDCAPKGVVPCANCNKNRPVDGRTVDGTLAHW